MIEVEGCAAVKSIQLPDNWELAQAQELGAGRRLDKYFSTEFPQFRFCSYLRELPLSHRAAQAFQEVLYSEFHELSDAEQDRLPEVIEGMSNRSLFLAEQAYTCYLNSRRVLRVHGEWTKTKEKSLTVFVDVQGNGQIVQQLFFVCPASEFQQMQETAENIFLSIQWQLAANTPS